MPGFCDKNTATLRFVVLPTEVGGPRTPANTKACNPCCTVFGCTVLTSPCFDRAFYFIFSFVGSFGGGCGGGGSVLSLIHI